MKKFLLLFLGVSVLSIGYAINRNSDYITSNRQVSGFSGIDAGQGLKVNVVHGDAESVVVKAPVDLIDNIVTEVKSGTLMIHWDKKSSIKAPRDIEVDVTAIEIARVKASSGATVVTDTIKGSTLVFAASSGAQINTMVAAGTVTVQSSSGSSVLIVGTAQLADFDVSSGARISGDKLTAAEGRANASSGGSASINVTTKFDAKASSGGSLRYCGTPSFTNVASSSGGSISRLK